MGLFSKSDRNVREATNLGQRATRAASDMVDGTSDKLRGLLANLDGTLSDAKHANVDDLRSALRGHLDTARGYASDAHASLRGNVNEAMDQADDLVRGNPWQALAVVAGAALLIGFLAGRS
jgi:ElaB/YqjD/DUF883 family membrane-anchored ribosome-binding protein